MAGPPMDPIVVVEGSVSSSERERIPEIDYSLFRYSRLAVPLLLFMLLWFVALLCLTIWQGNFTIDRIRPGVPRDLEPYAKEGDGDGGLSRGVRDLRLAAAIIAIIPIIVIAIVYYLSLRPKLTRIIALVCAVILVVAAILAIIAFALDVNHSDDVEQCVTDNPINRRRTCEAREAYGVALITLDILLFAFCLVTAVMLALWGKFFHRARSDIREMERDRALDNAKAVEEAGMKPFVPGRDRVYKTLIGLGLLAVLLTAILLLIFTILVHEFRERVEGTIWDPISHQRRSGWPRENTRLRVAITTIGILLVLLSLIPWPNRVFAYILGFLFLAVAICFFVAFAIDVNDLIDAQDLDCPTPLTGVHCIFHPYNTICVFDFICGILILIYLVYEFLIHKKKSRVRARLYTPYDDIRMEDVRPGALLAAEPPVGKDLAAAPVLAGGAMQPVLGIEVIEVEDPLSNDVRLSVMAVTPAGAADEAGIRVGDIITRWDEMPIRTKADFARAVGNASLGSTALIQVLRQAAAGPAAAPVTAVEYCKLILRGRAL
eukprot:TRINITY_DN15178_c0_g1_i1.p1 TRINITY_DN15178_c0_g1~~TRINITY_DN15178_c0_g1_i1.p1  ORF type:complete len:554 (+),score=72.09 TRINITY_DN15178_c0_g1_i1:22-1662(+)